MKKSAVVALFLAALSVSAANASVVTGKVVGIATSGLGVESEEFIIKVTPVSGAFAGCATNATGQVYFTVADGAHPTSLQLLTTAYTTGKNVKFTGINLCKNGSEILKDIALQ